MPLNLEPVQSGYNLSVINDNFQRIEDTWDEKLDRLSSTQTNYMEQELDMNSNHIINHPAPRTETDLVRLKELEQFVIDSDVEGVVPLISPRQVGDGVTTTFNAPHTKDASPQSFFVNIDGITQRPFADFSSPSAGTIEFNEAPPLNADIDITYFEPNTIEAVLNTPNGSDIQVLASGSTEFRSLKDRFADVANVRDFGAIGDGTADDTAALQLALSSSNYIFIPEGVYKVNSINIGSDKTVEFEGKLLVSSGETVTIDALIKADHRIIFTFEDNSSQVVPTDIPQWGVTNLVHNEIFPEWFGAISDAKPPTGSPATPVNAPSTGTDSTDGFKRAVKFALLASAKFPQLHKSGRLKVKCANGGQYLINGENALGNVLTEEGSSSDTSWFEFDGNGSTLYWNVPTTTSALIDHVNQLHLPTYKNFSIIGTGFSGTAGYVMRFRQSSVYSQGIEGGFESVHVKGGQVVSANTGWGIGNSFDRIFYIEGNIVQDRFTVNRCSFQNFKTLHYSGNQEAVSWSYLDSTIRPEVEDSVVINQNNRFSGNLDIVGCDVLFNNHDQILFKARYDSVSLDKAFYGEMYFRSRFESEAGKRITMVDATHGTYVLEGFNATAGNAAPDSNLVACRIGHEASVHFRNARIPRVFYAQVFTDSEWSDYLIKQPQQYNQITTENCDVSELQGPTLRLYDSSGLDVSWRDALTGNMHIRPIDFSGSHNGNIKYQMQPETVSNQFTSLRHAYTQSGYNYVTNPSDSSAFKTSMPPYSVINSIKVYSRAVSSSIADELGIYIADTQIATIPLSSSGQLFQEVIPDNNYGISLPNQYGSALLDLNIRPLLAGSPVNATVGGWANVEYQCIDNRWLLPATDVPTLI